MVGNGFRVTLLAAALLLVALPGHAHAHRAAVATATPTPIYPIPTPTPTVAPRSSLELLIVAIHLPALHGRRLSWTVLCLPHACHARFSVRLNIAGRHAVRWRPHRRVPATHALRVSVRLSRRTRRAVRSALHHHRRVTVTLAAKATDGRHHAASFRLRRPLRR